MPRKGKFGIDYDGQVYDAYADYDHDDDFEGETKKIASFKIDGGLREIDISSKNMSLGVTSGPSKTKPTHSRADYKPEQWMLSAESADTLTQLNQLLLMLVCRLDFEKPLLMPICDVIRSTTLGKISASGKLEAGALRSGLKVLVMPSGEVATVRTLERGSRACSIARAGDNVIVTLQGMDDGHLMAGGVLCHPNFPVAYAKHLELKVLLLDVAAASPMLIGSEVEFYTHHTKEPARVVKILAVIDAKGEVKKKSPRCLLAKQRAIIEVILQGPVCVEVYKNSKALGSVSLRASGNTVALAVVSRILS